MFPWCMQYVTDLLAYYFPQQKAYKACSWKAASIINLQSLSKREYLYCYSWFPQKINCLPTITIISLEDNTINFLHSFKDSGSNLTKRLCKENHQQPAKVSSASLYKSMISLKWIVDWMELSKCWECLLGFGVTKKVTTQGCIPLLLGCQLWGRTDLLFHPQA